MGQIEHEVIQGIVLKALRLHHQTLTIGTTGCERRDIRKSCQRDGYQTRKLNHHARTVGSQDFFCLGGVCFGG